MRDENLINTFERVSLRDYPAESDPSSYIREATTNAPLCICTWYIICYAYMHDSCTYVEDASGPCSTCVCIFLISPRTTSAYKLPNFLRELVQKVEKGKQCQRQNERTERGGTCTIQYPTNLVSRTGQISLTIQTNEIVNCTWYFIWILLANEIRGLNYIRLK